jgi:hypothetical protein
MYSQKCFATVSLIEEIWRLQRYFDTFRHVKSWRGVSGERGQERLKTQSIIDNNKSFGGKFELALPPG